jgi:hypothetical protein
MQAANQSETSPNDAIHMYKIKFIFEEEYSCNHASQPGNLLLQ